MKRFLYIVFNFFIHKEFVAAQIKLDYKKKLLALCQADLEKSGKK